MEIERKFLTTSIPFDYTTYPVKTIAQCYLSIFPTIRIRKSDTNFWLTIKGSGHLSHEEYELPLTQEEYEILLKKSETPILYKKRYEIPIGLEYCAEVDIYDGFLNGLITTEVEFSSEVAAKNFQPPAWFGIDVTWDPRYKNSQLARFGIPKSS